jgi:hypothetical protein
MMLVNKWVFLPPNILCLYKIPEHYVSDGILKRNCLAMEHWFHLKTFLVLKNSCVSRCSVPQLNGKTTEKRCWKSWLWLVKAIGSL